MLLLINSDLEYFGDWGQCGEWGGVGGGRGGYLYSRGRDVIIASKLSHHITREDLLKQLDTANLYQVKGRAYLMKAPK